MAIHLFLVALGGALGSMTRYLVTLASTHWLGSNWAYGTLFVNIMGSFLIGIVFASLQYQLLLSPYWRSLIMVGLLGGLTTFSTFSLDTYLLVLDNQWLKALGNISLNLIFSLTAVVAGYHMIKACL